MDKKSVANILSVNFKNVVALVVSILTTSIIARSLGIEEYSKVVVALNVAALLSVLSNPIIDHSLKDCIGAGPADSETVVKNSKTVVVFISAISIAIYWLISFFISKFNCNVFYSLTSVLLVSTLVSSVAQVYRMVGYSRERHVAQSIIFVISRVSYLLGVFCFVSVAGIGGWGVGLAAFVSAIALIIFMRRDVNSCGVKVDALLSFSSLSTVYHTVSKVWILLLAYLGAFLSASSLILLIGHFRVGSELSGAIAICAAFSTVATQLLSSVSYIGTPKILKCIKNNGPVAVVFSLTGSTVFSVLILAILVVYYAGERVIKIWLGVQAGNDLLLLVAAFCLGQISAVHSISIMQISIALDKIRMYSLASFAEGCGNLLVVSCWLFLNNKIPEYFIFISPFILYVLKVLYVKNKLSMRWMSYGFFNKQLIGVQGLGIFAVLLSGQYKDVLNGLLSLGVGIVFSVTILWVYLARLGEVK